MNSLLVAARGVLPLTMVMALGALAKKRGAVSAKAFREFNWVVFNYCLPMTLFMNIMDADLSTITDPGIVLFAIVSLCAVIVLAMAILKKTDLPDTKKGVIVQALFRSNFAILGLPLVENIYGAGNVGVTSILVAFVVPFFNVMAILVLQHYAGGKGSLKETVSKVLHNPMIIGALAGFVWKLSGIPFPSLAGDMISSFTRITSPLSLFVLGGSMNAQSLKENSRMLALYTFAKLILVPGILISLAVFAGYRQVELVSLLVLFGGPAAVASYAMSEQMGLDGELAAQCILVSTVSVILTMFCFITLLSSLALI